MKILMIGWEFPPLFAGGVGMVCYELSKALSQFNNIEITYIMPFGPDNFKKYKETQHLKELILANQKLNDKNISIKIHTIPVMFQAYMNPIEYLNKYKEVKQKNKNEKKSQELLYGENLYLEVERFAQKVKEIIKYQKFDLIHAHDWMTIPAGILAKKILNIPLIVHIHNTVYDRYLGMGGEYEKQIEKEGCDFADYIFCLANYPVAYNVKKYYNADEKKIRIVRNGGGSFAKKIPYLLPYDIVKKPKRLVSFMGRMVLQKGSEYFVKAGIKVLQHESNVKFLIAGDGHMVPELKRLVKEAGVEYGFEITEKPYSRSEGEKFYDESDIFVMPSISEPFGIVPIEALAKGTPVIVSKQSGIAEFLENCFKVDYWDTDELANKIIALLRYPNLYSHLRENSFKEVDRFNWKDIAFEVYQIYKEIIKNNKKISN